jgi:hypothetical protein
LKRLAVIIRPALLAQIAAGDVVFIFWNAHADIVLPDLTIIAADESSFVVGIVVAANAADLVLFVIFVLLLRFG